MKTNKRNFDNLTDKFISNIYGTAKGVIRQLILWEDLAPFLEEAKAPLLVLDAGGGEGVFSVKIAALGHRVIHCDISENMLNKAREHAEEHGVSSQITFHHCAINEIHQHLNEPVDLILCHAVLEWNQHQFELINTLKSLLKKSGLLSLMFYNYHSLLFRNVLAGNFEYTLQGMQKKKKRSLSPDYPVNPKDVYAWLDALNFTILQKSGVRIFNDYMQNKERAKTHFELLLELEKRYCRLEPYLSLARYIHVLCRND